MAQLNLLPGFPRAAFVVAGGAMYYLFQFDDEIQCQSLRLEGDDFVKLKGELATTGLSIVDRLFAEQECFVIAKELTSPAYSKITEATQFNPEFEIIGGEVYFRDEGVLLINHKSNNFRADAPTVSRMVSELWGSSGAIAFHPPVEKVDVDRELALRKSKPLIVSTIPPRLWLNLMQLCLLMLEKLKKKKDR